MQNNIMILILLQFVLLNHIHIILNPDNIEEYPKIITSIKYYFSKNYDVGVKTPIYGLNPA